MSLVKIKINKEQQECLGRGQFITLPRDDLTTFHLKIGDKVKCFVSGVKKTASYKVYALGVNLLEVAK